MDEITPNVNLNCSICGQQIQSICLLSPDWSATMSWKGALLQLREHNLKEHGVKPPND